MEKTKRFVVLGNYIDGNYDHDEITILETELSDRDLFQYCDAKTFCMKGFSTKEEAEAEVEKIELRCAKQRAHIAARKEAV